uniref:VWFA domain-containing protein n=1 Tax=Lates calcarifer TaxID=8187 RepID=A0A4W6DQR4_LATCA
SFHRLQRCQCCRHLCERKDEADIFFLMDASGSIVDEDFSVMKKFIIEFIHAFNIGPKHIRMGLVKYSDDPVLEFDLAAYSDARKLERAVEYTEHIRGRTFTGKALSKMGDLFVSRRQNVPTYLIVITDGKSDESDPVRIPAEKLRAQGIKIYAIGVKDSNEAELVEIAGDPKRTFQVTNFDALKSIKEDVIRDICIPDGKDSLSRQNCEEADVVFLLDRSSSITPENYTIMLNFTKELVKTLDVRKDFIRVGCAQFASAPHHEFYLSDYTEKKDVMSRIDRLSYIGGNTYLGEALKHIKDYFDASHGSRRSVGIPQNLVLISDGDSHDDVEEAADSLRALGIVVFAIAVGDVHDLQLLQIAGTPERLFTVQNFKVVKKLINHQVSIPTFFNRALLQAFTKTFETQSKANVKVRMTAPQNP